MRFKKHIFYACCTFSCVGKVMLMKTFKRYACWRFDLIDIISTFDMTLWSFGLWYWYYKETVPSLKTSMFYTSTGMGLLQIDHV